MNILSDLFERLTQVRHLHFAAQSLDGSQMAWNHSGRGETAVMLDHGLLTFQDCFQLDNGRLCRDAKQWQLQENGLAFFHYHEQSFQQIFTFFEHEGEIVCTQPYQCAPDCYTGELAFNDTEIILTIRIRGVRKNEVIQYLYR